MAPKRTLEQADANAQSAREPKQQKRTDAANEAENEPPADATAENESVWTDATASEVHSTILLCVSKVPVLTSCREPSFAKN